MRAISLLLKESVDVNGDGRETLKDDILDGYYTMGRMGAVPAFVLGSIGAYKAKGAKNRIVHGLAGVGAGYLGTFAAKAAYDAYQRHKHKKQEEALAALQMQGM